MSEKLRRAARAIWQAAVEAARPDELVRHALTDGDRPLRDALARAQRILVVGGGKAGAAMSRGVETALADRLNDVSGIVNVPDEVDEPLRAIRLHAGRPAGTNQPTAEGVAGEFATLPLDATPVYEIEVRQPSEEIPKLRQRYPDAENHLVRIRCTYTAGKDNREETLRELEEIFPRWYDRHISESSALGPTLHIGEAPRHKSFRETVRDYLDQELQNHPDDLQQDVLAKAEALMREMSE